MAVQVENVTKRFGPSLAVDDVTFAVPSGELAALLGPSGSGKSTLLRVIAGLERPDAGTVRLAGEEATAVPARRRGVGFVFQHYALFRHLTVRRNIAFGLEVRKRPRAEVRARTEELLALVQMQGLADRYPSQLSGGQRQRVALARALAPGPRVLLLDEPFSALDARARDELRSWIRRLHEEIRVTTLLVTHDQKEAFEIADRAIVLNRGRLVQMGPPQELYDRPETPFAAEFLGSINRLRGRVRDARVLVGGAAFPPGRDVVPDGPVSVYVRPHDLEVGRERGPRPSWPARVRRLVLLDGHVRLETVLQDGTEVQVQVTRDRQVALGLRPGDAIHIAPRDLKIFPTADPAPSRTGGDGERAGLASSAPSRWKRAWMAGRSLVRGRPRREPRRGRGPDVAVTPPDPPSHPAAGLVSAGR